MREDLRDDIKTTSDNVIADARKVTEIELRKHDPTVTPAELEQLSEEAQRVANDLARKATVEKHLVGAANAQDRLRRAGK